MLENQMKLSDMKNIFRQIKILLIVIICNFCTPSYANADIGDFLSWISNSILELFGLMECIDVPNFNNFRTGSKSITITDQGKWISTDITVEGDKFLQINWTLSNVVVNPRKYYIMYRIDPRFSRPQLFILEYDYSKKKYISDFHSFNNNSLVTYKNVPANEIPNLDVRAASTAFNNYYNFVGRNKIQVASKDVVSLTIVQSNDFFSASSEEFSSELDPQFPNALAAYTSSSLPDNQILYMDSNSWCKNYLQDLPNGVICADWGGEYLYGTSNPSINRMVGLMDTALSRNMNTCPAGSVGRSFESRCVYDKGRAMPITVGGKLIKPAYSPFSQSIISGPNSPMFFHYESQGQGDLDFVDSSAISNSDMFSNFNQYMTNWENEYGNHSNIINAWEGGGGADALSSFLHLGRYIMLGEIGGGDELKSLEKIKVSYAILPANNNDQTEYEGDGIQIPQNYYGNAPATGKLFLKIETNGQLNLSGSVNVGYAGYTGETFLSDVLYNSITLPVMSLMRETSAAFYQALAINPQWQLTVRTLLTLYIVIYGLYFLSGMVQIHLRDLVTRVIKIAVVFAMFSGTSWDFFSQNVFNLFLDGMSYLFGSVVGLTSSSTNVFGFVDVVFDKYLDPVLWQLLLYQLISFTNGLTLLAVLVIISIVKFMSVVIEVLVAYLFGFCVIAILISFAPLFIVCMLFEKTRGIFDNWFSLLFNYMIQPTILLILFLIIDQLMTNQLTQAITRACWGYIISFTINIPWVDGSSISFVLPFITGIPGFVPEISEYNAPGGAPLNGADARSFLGIFIGSMMFWVYSELIKGLNGYATQIASVLTNATPARQTVPN
jgi:type IV secretion system protein VirB6